MSITNFFRQSSLFWAVGIVILAGTLTLFATQPVSLQQVDLKIFDTFTERAISRGIHPAPLIVDIDEASLKNYGQWPWPRYRMAQLIEQITEAGAASIAFDIVLAEADRTSPAAILQAINTAFGSKAAITGLSPDLMDNDALLARVAKQTPLVLGAYVHFSSNTTDTTEKQLNNIPAGVPVVERIIPGGRPAKNSLVTGAGMLAPLPTLAAAAPVAFFNMMLEQDGLVRRVPLVLQVQDTIYASLAVRALMRAMNVRTLRLNSGLDGIESLGIGSLTVPTNPDGTFTVPWNGPGYTYPYVSAGDILAGKVDPEHLHGRVVFVGTSAVGLQDIRSTPLDRYMPGVEVHANVADAILTGRSIQTPPWNAGMQATIIFISGLLSAVLFALLKPAYAGICGLVLVGGLYVGSVELFTRGLFITPLWGMLSTVLHGCGIMFTRLWCSERDKRRIRDVFSRYVSPEIVRRIVERGGVILTGEERQLTIMFTDLRGFTSMSEKLQPEEVVSLLNQYFTPMTALIRTSEGTLDKFIGDALMAFWNAPLDVAEHPRKAVLTALAMLDMLDTLNPALHASFGVTLRMGAGLHTGYAHVGNMGSVDLTSYTAIGDSVNLASRIEGLCSKFGIPLALSGETAMRCIDAATEQHGATILRDDTLTLIRLARLRVKGRDEPVDVYTGVLHKTAATRADEFLQYATALESYRSAIQHGNKETLHSAQALFSALYERMPSMLIYKLYVLSCTELSIQPAETWTDVWTFTNK